MLNDAVYLSAEADRRHAALLADAANFRLARAARAVRRARTRIAAASERSRRKDDAERRSAVPR